MSSSFQQPPGLRVLAITEAFERFSFYTLQFLLVLFASAPTQEGGLGWSNAQALSLAGLYTMGAYGFPVIGAFLADRVLGIATAVFFGGFLIILGHFFMLFVHSTGFFYTALTLVAVGTGFFKPCMPALLGNLYHPNDSRRESGFSWYYFGINMGAMLAGMVGGLLLKYFGFQIALSSAGVGMIVGLCILLIGRKHVFVTPMKRTVAPPSQQGFHLKQKKSFYALLWSFGFFALWATAYNLLVSGTLSLYLEKFTNKHVLDFDVPTTFFMSLESVTILLVTPLFTGFLAFLARKKKYPHFFSQMNLGLGISAVALLYFSFLAFSFQNSQLSHEKIFHWSEISFFIALISVSEVMISPVMMSAISVIASHQYKSFFQSLYLLCFASTGLLASQIGAFSLKHPGFTFLITAVTLCIGTLCYFFARKAMIKALLTAHEEK
jgi:POT family proton-dependent oligopeptide transporter